MHQPSTFSDASTPTAQATSPLLSGLARWWSRAAPGPASETALGYESALPWTLFDGPVDTPPTPTPD